MFVLYETPAGYAIFKVTRPHECVLSHTCFFDWHLVYSDCKSLQWLLILIDASIALFPHFTCVIFRRHYPSKLFTVKLHGNVEVMMSNRLDTYVVKMFNGNFSVFRYSMKAKWNKWTICTLNSRHLKRLIKCKCWNRTHFVLSTLVPFTQVSNLSKVWCSIVVYRFMHYFTQGHLSFFDAWFWWCIQF